MPEVTARELAFLEQINDKQAEMINHLEREVIFLRNQNSQILNKLTATNKIERMELKDTDVPVGGYIPLRQRISDAEAESLRQSIEEMEKNNAS